MTTRPTLPPAARRATGARRGVALPMVILLVAVVTLILTAGFAATSGEAGATVAMRGQTRALSLAQAGLQTYLAGRDSLCRTAGTTCIANPNDTSVAALTETLQVTFPAAMGLTGRAVVTARRVRPRIGTAAPVFFISSRGLDTSARSSGFFRQQNAERTVGMYARWNTSTIQVRAAWLALTGLTKNGTGLISGIDQCGQSTDTLPGIMVPTGDLDVNGGSANFLGKPPRDESKTLDQLKASNKIDWNGVRNNDAIAATHVVGPGFESWDSRWFADPNAYPIIHVKNTPNFSLPSAGRGMLIVDEGLTISGSNMWDGVILVGGALTSNGSNVVAGATLTGLNTLLPGYVPPNGNNGKNNSLDDDNSVGNGTKKYIYDSCEIDKATKGLQRFVPMTNAWVDNVPSYAP